MNAYTNQYQKNHIFTATPEQILIMLYDGAIRFTRQAIMAGEQSNQVLKLEKISKSLAIIAEFSNSLNHKIGGEIAADLDALYQFMIRELNAARKDDTGKKLKTVEGLLVDLRETWSQAIDIKNQPLDDAGVGQKIDHQTEKPYVALNAAG